MSAILTGHAMVLEQPVDTSTSAGRALLGLLAVFAAFEADIRRERRAEGIVKVKRVGVDSGGGSIEAPAPSPISSASRSEEPSDQSQT
jgi:DNA invertase Pin-like site-specific DNA recombinase